MPRGTRQAPDQSFGANRYVEPRIGELPRDVVSPVHITPIELCVTVESHPP
jgi:hypothetical protein